MCVNFCIFIFVFRVFAHFYVFYRNCNSFFSFALFLKYFSKHTTAATRKKLFFIALIRKCCLRLSVLEIYAYLIFFVLLFFDFAKTIVAQPNKHNSEMKKKLSENDNEVESFCSFCSFARNSFTAKFNCLFLVPTPKIYFFRTTFSCVLVCLLRNGTNVLPI